MRAPIESWNEAALADALTYRLTQLWLLVTPTEMRALLDGVVSTKIRQQCARWAGESIMGTDA